MTPVTWWDYPVWIVSSALIGLTAATYVRVPGGPGGNGVATTAGGGVLAAFAIGCPICNKLVVGVLGVSGALTYWAPLQPLLGIGSIAILAVALALRLRGEVACPVPAG